MACRTSLTSAAAVLLVLVLWSHAKLLAQEVAFLDLTQIDARVDLRHPPLPDDASTPRGGTHAAYACNRLGKPAGIMRTTLVALDRSQYSPGDQPTFEVRLENIGQVPLVIPFSPHLADLQPEDPGQKFSFTELSINLWIGGRHWATSSAAFAELYGREDRPDTVLTLHSGEWARIIAKGRMGLMRGKDDEVSRLNRGDPIDHANAKTSIAHTEMILAPAANASVSHDVCLVSRQGPDIPLTMTEPPE